MEIDPPLNSDPSESTSDHEIGKVKTAQEENESTTTEPLFMYQYLQKLGEKQKQIIENFYQSAVDGTCQNITCDGSTAEGFMCHFLSSTEGEQGDLQGDALNQHIVGPIACEYCKNSDTSKCDESCERPKLFFIKRRSPFENSAEGYSKSGEYLEDLSNNLKQLHQLKDRSGHVEKRSDSMFYKFTF